tara:strand:- start:125 stop:706 length:582 start_codon:yes stop_codon:yes gene_type:complete
MENFDHVKQNYEKYLGLLRKFFSNDTAKRLEDEMGERLFLAPRDLTPTAGGEPGGLVSFAVSVAKYSKLFGKNLDQKKLVRVALLHELGKLGGPLEGQDLFLSETSDWHREKLGRHYKYNENCPKMSSAHRTLFYVARYGFRVDEEEWLALATSAGFQYDENRFYANECLPLAQALHTCRTFARRDMLKNAAE